VIIPTYERPRQLERCLAALRRMDYPRACFEVIVVDDGGGVPLDPLVEVAASDIDVRLVVGRHGGPAAARNLGMAQARHEHVAFTDDDCQPRRDWLRILARVVDEYPDGAIAGRAVNALRDDLCAEASQLLIDVLGVKFNHAHRGVSFATTNNLVFPTAALRELGGFDTRFPRAGGEDRDLCDRWVQSGRRIHRADDAIVDHYHAMTLASFCRQHFHYGRGAYAFRRARAERHGSRVQLESVSFYLDLLRLPQADVGAGARLRLLLLISQLANATGFAVELARQRIATRRR